MSNTVSSITSSSHDLNNTTSYRRPLTKKEETYLCCLLKKTHAEISQWFCKRFGDIESDRHAVVLYSSIERRKDIGTLIAHPPLIKQKPENKKNEGIKSSSNSSKYQELRRLYWRALDSCSSEKGNLLIKTAIERISKVRVKDYPEKLFQLSSLYFHSDTTQETAEKAKNYLEEFFKHDGDGFLEERPSLKDMVYHLDISIHLEFLTKTDPNDIENISKNLCLLKKKISCCAEAGILFDTVQDLNLVLKRYEAILLNNKISASEGEERVKNIDDFLEIIFQLDFNNEDRIDLFFNAALISLEKAQSLKDLAEQNIYLIKAQEIIINLLKKDPRNKELFSKKAIIDVLICENAYYSKNLELFDKTIKQILTQMNKAFSMKEDLEDFRKKLELFENDYQFFKASKSLDSPESQRLFLLVIGLKDGERFFLNKRKEQKSVSIKTSTKSKYQVASNQSEEDISFEIFYLEARKKYEIAMKVSSRGRSQLLCQVKESIKNYSKEKLSPNQKSKIGELTLRIFYDLFMCNSNVWGLSLANAAYKHRLLDIKNDAIFTLAANRFMNEFKKDRSKNQEYVQKAFLMINKAKIIFKKNRSSNIKKLKHKLQIEKLMDHLRAEILDEFQKLKSTK